MRLLGRIAAGLLVLVWLLLVGAWLVPPFLDWDRYRDDVAALASAALGQPVRIEGPIALRLLPQPLLEAGRIAVAGDQRGAALTARQLRLRVALGPLLAGRVDAQELVLRGADIRLPWPLDPTALALRSPGWLSSLSARLEDGRLTLGEVVVSGIDATLDTGDLSGSFLSAGRAKAGGRDWMFTVRVSRPGGDGAVGLDVTLDGQGAAQGLGTTVSGQVQADGTMLGRLAVRGPNLGQLLPAPAVPFRAEGRISFGGGLLAADELVGDVAGSPVQGAVALRLSPVVRLDVALAASRLDLDAWAPALLQGAEGGALAGMKVGLDLSAEAAGLGGGVLRGVRGAFDIGGGILVVRELRAILPGDATLRLEGNVAQVAVARPDLQRPDLQRPDLRFDGKVLLAAPALRTTIAWAVGTGPFAQLALPPGVMRSAEVEMAVRLERDALAVSGVTGRVDGAGLVANVSLGLVGKPSVRALLALERLDLDAWLPATWPNLAGAADILGGLSLDVQLEAKTARLRGVAVAPLALELAGEPGKLVLRRLEAQSGGMGLSASGTLLEGGRIVDARAELRAAKAETVAALLPPALAPWAARLPALLEGPLLLQAQANGAPAALGVKLTGEIGDLRMEATPTIDAPAGRWATTLSLRHPGAPRLAEVLGLPDAGAWLGDGSFALQAQLAGQGAMVAAEGFDLVAGLLRARGALRLDPGEVPRLSGRLAMEALPLPRWRGHGAEPLAFDALQGWTAALQLEAGQVLVAQAAAMQAAAATLSLERGVLRLDLAKAEMAGGVLAGGMRADTATRPPTLALDAMLTGAQLDGPVLDAPVDLVAGRVDVTVALAAAGFSPAGLLANLGGRITVQGKDGVLSGLALARMGNRLEEADLRAALAGGTTPFATLAAEGVVERGGLTLQRFEATGPDGRISASGTVDLARALLALRLALVPAVPDAPEIGLRLTGTPDRMQRVPELAGATRWRNDHPVP